ncbi:MAG: amidohydrolase [Bacteroidetes bacterium]|nr:MAG: amidohydrolase [Bacteroidota bacterium]
MKRIDAHQHFWKYDPVTGAWITDEMQVIRRDFMPSDLQPLLEQHGIDGCVAVQAEQSLAENTFLLGLADQHPFIRGVVGWVDLKSAHLAQQMEPFLDHPTFKGVRHILQAEPDGFMTDPRFIRGVAWLGQQGLTYDILTTEKQLAEVVQFVEALPAMPLVIDHISKPNIAQASFSHWASHMQRLSAFEHVCVKLSGMITEAHWQSWKPEDLAPYVDFCLKHFGPERLMYGSDWPVCLVAGTYAEAQAALAHCLASLSPSEKEAIFGLTARRFYSLD